MPEVSLHCPTRQTLPKDGTSAFSIPTFQLIPWLRTIIGFYLNQLWIPHLAQQSHRCPSHLSWSLDTRTYTKSVDKHHLYLLSSPHCLLARVQTPFQETRRLPKTIMRTNSNTQISWVSHLGHHVGRGPSLAPLLTPRPPRPSCRGPPVPLLRPF